MVGHPKMLGIGEADSELDADMKVKSIIDRSIKLHN